MNNAQNGEKNVNIQTSKNRRVINRKTLEFLGRSSSICQPDLPELAGRTRLPDGSPTSQLGNEIGLFFQGFLLKTISFLYTN